MESMSRAPYLLEKARSGYRLGHGALIDSMFLDGLEDAYEPGRLMGTFAEDCAARLGIGRERQDAYAQQSLARARQRRPAVPCQRDRGGGGGGTQGNPEHRHR